MKRNECDTTEFLFLINAHVIQFNWLETFSLLTIKHDKCKVLAAPMFLMDDWSFHLIIMVTQGFDDISLTAYLKKYIVWDKRKFNNYSRFFNQMMIIYHLCLGKNASNYTYTDLGVESQKDGLKFSVTYTSW